MNSIWKVALSLFMLCFLSSWMLGSTVRESDQVSIMTGALELFRNEDWFSGEYYNYHRQFLTYWFVACALKLVDLFSFSSERLSHQNVLIVGNLLNFLTFYAGLAFYLRFWILQKGSRGLFPKSLVCALVLSPVVVLSTPFLASAVFSAGALLFLCAFTFKEESKWQLPICGLGAFLAVGFRIDAVLLMPLLLLGKVRKGRVFTGEVVKFAVAISVGTSAALALSYFLPRAGQSSMIEPFWHGRVAASYLLFGGGVSWIAIIVLLKISSRNIRRNRNWRERVHCLLVLFAFLLPLGFYLFRLTTPRYLMLTVIASMILLAHPQTSVFLRAYSMKSRGAARRLGACIIVSVFITLFVGLTLPTPLNPSLTLRKSGTVFPTADGHWPMFGILAFSGELRKAMSEPVDHNQRLWNSLQSYWNSPQRPSTVFAPRSLTSIFLDFFAVADSNTDVVSQDGSVIVLDHRSYFRNHERFQALLKKDKNHLFSNPSKVFGGENASMPILLWSDSSFSKPSSFFDEDLLSDLYHSLNDEVVVIEDSSAVPFFLKRGYRVGFLSSSTLGRNLVTKRKNFFSHEKKPVIYYEVNEELYSILPMSGNSGTFVRSSLPEYMNFASFHLR